MSDKSVGELMSDLARLVEKHNRLQDNRCIECGSRDVMLYRCRTCEQQFQLEQRTYR